MAYWDTLGFGGEDVSYTATLKVDITKEKHTQHLISTFQHSLDLTVYTPTMPLNQNLCNMHP